MPMQTQLIKSYNYIFVHYKHKVILTTWIVLMLIIIYGSK